MTTTRAATAETAAIARGSANAAPRPYDCASSGMVMAATADPAGCDIWRTPMASPRRCAGNQLTTSRPLAELPEAVKAPVTSSNTASNTNDSTNSAAVRVTAAPTDPATRTTFSPARSTSQPHAINAAAMPTSGIATRIPPCERDSPMTLVRWGSRKPTPITNADPDAATNVATASTSQCRAVTVVDSPPTVSTCRSLCHCPEYGNIFPHRETAPGDYVS